MQRSCDSWSQGKQLCLECKRERGSVAHDMAREVSRGLDMLGLDGFFKDMYFSSKSCRRV